MRLSEIVRILEEIAPPEYAKSDDAIGLQVGDPAQEVRRVVVTVDVTPAVVAESIRRGVGLIVSHHPLISPKYSPVSSVRADAYPASLVYELVGARVGLYVMHTNFDAAPGGINDVLAERLGIVDTRVLEPTYTGKLFKLVTFVPAEAVDAVRVALSEAGAGVIGNYARCSFQCPGVGTFEPMPGAEPYSGEVGRLSHEPELRLEMLVDEPHLHDSISALLEAHPYDEVAYDVYPLQSKVEEFGLARLGRLRSPMTFDGFCEMVRDALEVEDLRVSGDPEAMVEKIALVGGGGGSWVGKAAETGADVYLTGDVGHHQMLQARALGLSVVDATHFWTERPGMMALTPRLCEILSEREVAVEYVDDVVLGIG